MVSRVWRRQALDSEIIGQIAKDAHLPQTVQHGAQVVPCRGRIVCAAERSWRSVHHYPEALIEKLLLYVHERLLQGQPAEDVFAQLFAKQRVVLAP